MLNTSSETDLTFKAANIAVRLARNLTARPIGDAADVASDVSAMLHLAGKAIDAHKGGNAKGAEGYRALINGVATKYGGNVRFKEFPALWTSTQRAVTLEIFFAHDAVPFGDPLTWHFASEFDFETEAS